MPMSIAFSPEGHLIPDDLAEESSAFAPAQEKGAREALQAGDAATLLWLAGWKSTTGLPLAALFWRDLAGRFLTRFCQTGGRGAVAAPEGGEVLAWIDQAPPIRGGEYLSSAALQSLWRVLDEEIALRCQRHPQGAAGWLRETMPHWHLVGRVTFHLAENKKDPEKPFAFLATFTSGLNAEGKPRHRPLQQALKEYAGAQNREALLNLLEPVQLAAEKSEWAKRMLDSRALYQPQAWTPAQALEFLRESPKLEETGVSVRIPDWWKAKNATRPQVSVTIGKTAPSAFNVSSLLSFTIEITLQGEKLTPQELESLKTAEGLTLLRGHWVEVDPDKLKAVFNHWKHAQRMNLGGGIPFHLAMRMLAGAGLEGKDQEVLPEETREWTGVEAGPWLEELLRDLRSPEKLETLAQPPDLRATLRPYQSVGVTWLNFMTRLGLGACLADDMGLGKTLQLLALLLHLRETQPDAGPTLLVAPASLLANWKAEAARFAPSLGVFVAHPSSEETEDYQALTQGKTRALRDADLVITSYGMVLRTTVLRTFPWRLAVLDEAQAIKNPASATTRAVKEIRAQGRIILTGTPVENRLGDLWSLFDFINPGLLGNSAAFSRFAKSLAKQEGMGYGPLRKLVRPYILRRLKTDKAVISDLPDKVEMNAWCLLTKPQAILYQRTVAQLAKELRETDAIHRKGIILASLSAFKQICNHPAQRSGDAHYAPEDSGKFLRLRELCQPIAERQERVLVFTQFTEIIPALRDFLKGIFGREGLVLTGQTPVKQRRGLVEEYQKDGGPPFFILSLKAGGTGLTLTSASHVIHFDRWWNPAVENQATDRAFRIGQKKNVLVHKFICRGTLEEKIDRLIADKRSLSDSVLSEGSEVPLTEMSDAELLQFVSLDVNQVAVEN